MLTEVLKTVVEHLQGTDRLQGVDIVHEEQQDIADRVKKNLAPKTAGSMILVKFGRMNSSSPHAPGPHLDEVNLEVVCYESPQINRGKNRLTALQLAEVAADWLHWPNHTDEARLQELQTVFRTFGTSNIGSLLVWSAFFESNFTLQPQE